MALFLFIVSCVVFISTITCISYKLSEAKNMKPKIFAALGFVLAFVPPLALLYIALLAFRNDSALVE